MSTASSIARWCISDQYILFAAPSAITPMSFDPDSVWDSDRRPLKRRICHFE